MRIGALTFRIKRFDFMRQNKKDQILNYGTEIM